MLNNFFIEDHVKNALQEDIGFGDITTDYLTNEEDEMSCTLNTRVDGIFCGKNVFETVFRILSPKIEIKFYFNDGDKIKKGDKIPWNHTARHAFNTLLKNNHVEGYDRKVYLGHSPGSGVNEGYTHKSKEEEKRIVEIADNFCRFFVEDI